MIEQAKINIGGKEYVFMKPAAKDLIQVEDECVSDDLTMDEYKYMTGLLKLVALDIDIEKLVKKNLTPVELSSGEKATPNDISYKQYTGIIKSIPNVKSRNEIAKAYLKLCGVEENIDLIEFTYNDINELAIAFKQLFDTSELDEVMTKLINFCLS